MAEHPRDALHRLPLDTLPIQTPGLGRHQLVKNSRMETVVELFGDQATGRGHVGLDALPQVFPGAGAVLRRDLEMLTPIQTQPSFDVYSLRISLRELGIEIPDRSALSLTETKRLELTERMKRFTRPLIAQVYGETAEAQDLDDLLDMVRTPDARQAMENLQRIAQRLDVRLAEIPRFLEDYGDIFLSLAYFREALDSVRADAGAFTAWLDELESAWNVRNDRQNLRMVQAARQDIGKILGALDARFAAFDRDTEDFWTEINAQRFETVRRAIAAHHRSVGGALCGLTLKMDRWRLDFGQNKHGGGPQRRLEFVRREMEPGLDRIAALARAAAPKGGNPD